MCGLARDLKVTTPKPETAYTYERTKCNSRHHRSNWQTPPDSENLELLTWAFARQDRGTKLARMIFFVFHDRNILGLGKAI